MAPFENGHSTRVPFFFAPQPQVDPVHHAGHNLPSVTSDKVRLM
jgi:hypothetical protein